MSARTPDGPSGPAERAREAAYREFTEPGALPDGARPEEAEARLGAMLERELGVTIDREPTAAEAAADGRVVGSIARRPRRLRTMLSLAATIAVVAGASWIALSRQAGREAVLRGATTKTGGSWNAEPTLQASASRAARLSWHGAPGADSYTIVFLGSDLRELARVSGLADTAFVLTAVTKPAAIPADAQGLWRVDAYAGEDELARSPASPITFP